MGRISPINFGDLPSNEIISERRAVCLDKPDEKSRYVDCFDIAEGCGRGSNKEYAQFIQIALGSAFEIDYQSLLARDLEYLRTESYNVLNEKIDKIKRQLASLLKKIRETL